MLLLAGCGGGPLDDPNVLHRGLGTDPESLDAQRARSVQAADVLRDIGEGLTGYSADGRLVPAAAESWTASDDLLRYTFTIRNGARWSNGEALTAEHFVHGLRRLVDPTVGAFYASALSDIRNASRIIGGDAAIEELGVTAADATTLVIELNRPVPYLLSLLTHPSTFPALTPDGNETDSGLASNGAYTLAEWRQGSLLTLRRNSQYWNDAATAIDEVRYHVIIDAASQLARYRADELHVTDNVPPEQFAAIRERYGEQLRVGPYLGVYYYGFNLNNEPFRDNRALREALSMAVDRRILVEKVTGRGESAAFSWVPPGTDNYDPPELSYVSLDDGERVALAQSLYAEAGYGDDNPLSFELRYNTSDTEQSIALAIQAMWRDTLGAEVTLVNEEFKLLLANIRSGIDIQLFRGSWIGDYNDAHTFLGLMRSDDPGNMTRYANPTYDDLLERAAESADPERRRLYLEEAERVLLADHAVIPLYFYVSKHLVRPEVRGWQDNVLDYHYSQHLSLESAQ